MTMTAEMIVKMVDLLGDQQYGSGLTVRQLTDLLAGDEESTKTRNVILGIVTRIREGKVPKLSVIRNSDGKLRIAKASAYNSLLAQVEQFRHTFMSSVRDAKDQLTDDQLLKLQDLADRLSKLDKR